MKPQTDGYLMTADCIIINDLTVSCVIGCLDWERQIQQPLQIDLRLFVDLTAAGDSDDLADTINYADICSTVEQTLIQTQAKLLEYAAGQVLAALFSKFGSLQQIHITVRKPAIIPAAQAVGIALERHRDHFRARLSQ